MKAQGFFAITNVRMTEKKITTVSKNSVFAYFSGAFEEFGKITWPTKEQAALLTGIVVGVSLVCALALGIYDFGLNYLYQLLLAKISS